MKYALLENHGKYAIERTFTVFGIVFNRRRLDMRDLSYWWHEECQYWTTACWTDDATKAFVAYSRLAGDSEILANT